MESNDRVGVAVAQPKSNLQRTEVATQCHDLLEMNMPVLVDGVDDRVGRAYSGMPDRLYVIDRAGKVAFKSGRGPFWFNPDEMEQALIMLLLDEIAPVKKPPARGPADGAAEKRRLPVDSVVPAPAAPSNTRTGSGPQAAAAKPGLDLGPAQKSSSHVGIRP